MTRCVRPVGVSWVMRMPRGLREQPAWIYIGALCALAGASYLSGLAESTTITRIMPGLALRIWGGFLLNSGMLLIYSTWTSRTAMERLSLRLLSVGLLVYLGWIWAAVPFGRAVLPSASILSLVGLARIRAAYLRVLINHPAPPVEESRK